MTEFDRALEKVTEWISEYQTGKRNFPVLSPLKPGEVQKQIPAFAPPKAESFDAIFSDFRRIILPGITHWQHPKFFAYFPANSSPPSLLAEMLMATLGVQGMSWATSPAATELETRVMEWMRDLFGFGNRFTGSIQDSASNATLAAMVVARERATGFAVNEDGYYGQTPLVGYCSSEAHSSVEKAAKAMGMGRKNLRKIDVDENQAMKIDLLEKAIEADRAAGKKPFLIVGAFGTTGSTAVDNLSELARIAKKHQLWFHVDAAYAGAVLALPEMRSIAKGIEDADSIVINPHKWLLTNFDCSTLFVRDAAELVKTFTLLPEYLKTPEADTVINFRDWGLGLGRRFRSLKLWFVLRWYGVEGIQKILRGHLEMAKDFQKWVRQDTRFEIMAPLHFNLICFRLKKGDDATFALMHRLNNSGKMYLTHTKLHGTVVLRVVIGQTDTTPDDVKEAWNLIEKFAGEV